MPGDLSYTEQGKDIVQYETQKRMNSENKNITALLWWTTTRLVNDVEGNVEPTRCFPAFATHDKTTQFIWLYITYGSNIYNGLFMRVHSMLVYRLLVPQWCPYVC